MTLTFLGAARTVTGSKYLLRSNGHQVLIDCGLFQGLKSLRLRNWEPLPVEAGAIDAVVLTHAHLDHCGFLPRLVNQGFQGRVFCTGATAELARIVLEDAGRIQEEDAERANRKGYTKHHPALPLFSSKDADRAIVLLQPVGYERPMPIAPGMTAEFLNAGHLLGSSYVRVTVEHEGKTLLFGGDLGRFSRPVLPDPTPVRQADVLLVESTYGDRLHEEDDDGAHLAKLITTTVERGGKVIIPAFALGRVEEVLYWIKYLEEARRIPIVPVYVDSPMAATVLKTYRSRVDELDPDIAGSDGDDTRARAFRNLCAFCTVKLQVVSSVRESRAVQESKTPAIIVSASGMATGGRVLHHLVRTLPDARNTIIFSGYQAAGTRGRHLREGARSTRIHGKDIAVAATIDSLDATSAHADAGEIMRWLGVFERPPDLTCLVHGDEEPMDTLKGRIEKELGWTVKTPEHQETIHL